MPRRDTSIQVALPSSQDGTALVMALVLLLVCTVIAISASSSSLLQQRMTNGLHQAHTAHMFAETALRGAEWLLWSETTDPTTSLLCGNGTLSGWCYRYDPEDPVYAPNGAVTRFRHSPEWIDAGSREYRGPGGTIDYTALPHNGSAAKNPVFIIEDLGVELPPGVGGGPSESGANGAGRSGYGSYSRHIYRVTARAVGANENILRVLESTYAAKSN